MADISKYLVKGYTQVISYLKLLKSEQCLISAIFGDDDKETFLTVILDIDEKKQTITIDCGPKEYLNKKLLSSQKIKFTTQYQGIKVFFEAQQIKKAGKIGHPAFSTSIPKPFYWLERRDFYRVKLHFSKNNFCLFHLTDPETKETSSFKAIIFDLSASGFSVIINNPEFSNQLTPFQSFENCELSLENEKTLAISIEIRNQYPLNPNKPDKTKRIGCSITNSTPLIESTILRYMHSVERERQHLT